MPQEVKVRPDIGLLVLRRVFRYITLGSIWRIIGLMLIGFAVSITASIKVSSTNEPAQVIGLMYTYGVAVITIIVVLGVLLIIFPPRYK
jgi:hypothetical protein